METALAATAELLRKGPQPGGVLCDTSLLRERCADMLVALEQARSAAELGLASLSQPDGRRRAYATSVTKAVIIRTSNFVCGEAIHLHGGMGNAEDGRIERVFHFATAANSQRGSLDLHLSRMAMFM
jgi:alkylation response protein AidB-like acyl-CoA dehydrogenase